MIISRRKYIFLFFLAPGLVLTKLFINIPKELEWNIVLFLWIMVIFDQVNLKTFSGFGYSFFNVILSLIIFDKYSVIYGFIYLLMDCLVTVLWKRRGRLQASISLLFMYIIIIIICNEFYNEYSDKTYLARYMTSLMMLFLSILLKYCYVFIETKRVSSKLFLDRFGPMMFEILIIFPILAFFNRLEVNLVLILFLSYYTFIGLMHRKFLAVNQTNIHFLTERITSKYGVQILFMDLNEIKGLYHVGKKMIIIDEKLDYPEQLQTIIHELLHYQTNKQFHFPKKMEEVIITLFEAIISWYYIIMIEHRSELD
jgi:hypothetical protein